MTAHTFEHHRHSPGQAAKLARHTSAPGELATAPGCVTEEVSSPMTDDATASATPRPVSRRLRFEILRRDNHTCRYCGAKAPDVKLTVDHVVPVALGGTNEAGNLVTACTACNSGKGSTSPDEHIVAEVSDLAVRMAQALEQVSAQRSAQLQHLATTISVVDAAWLGWTFNGDPTKTVWRPDDWAKSITAFINGGLTDPADITHFIDVAMRSTASRYDKWRYFCGCCWKEIGKRQDMAKQILATTPTITADDIALEPLDFDTPDDDYIPPARPPERSIPYERWANPDCDTCFGAGFWFDDDDRIRCWCLRDHPYDRTVGEY